MDTQVHVISDPRSGQVLDVPVGTRLAVKFARRGLGQSRWRIAERPAYLVPLTEEGFSFDFVVFEADDAAPLRLERFRPDREGTSDERELYVVPRQR
jgi:hypothetical protein